MLFVLLREPANSAIYTLSLHDALPIWGGLVDVFPGGIDRQVVRNGVGNVVFRVPVWAVFGFVPRSEEHTSELQSRPHLVCRLLLEKKNVLTKPPIYCPSTTNDYSCLCS